MRGNRASVFGHGLFIHCHMCATASLIQMGDEIISPELEPKNIVLILYFLHVWSSSLATKPSQPNQGKRRKG
jgi:hypothetical protein